MEKTKLYIKSINGKLINGKKNMKKKNKNKNQINISMLMKYIYNIHKVRIGKQLKT
jgi:hypothetical protein